MRQVSVGDEDKLIVSDLTHRVTHDTESAGSAFHVIQFKDIMGVYWKIKTILLPCYHIQTVLLCQRSDLLVDGGHQRLIILMRFLCHDR